VDEAASMDVLCSDKTGTLTQNELAVTAVRPMGGFDEARVLQLAALASADMGPDPVDTAVRTAASRYAATDSPQLLKFIPFDPSTKMAEASTVDRDGAPLRAVKGAFAIVSGLAGPSPEAASAAHQPEKQGFRVLAVAVGAPTAMRIAGAVLDGPLALDNAISRDAAAIKHINSPVAGDADILLVPDLEAGNMLAKELSFLADADAAGIVLGACVPIILTSRADNVRTRLASCAVAALYAHDRRVAAAEVGKLAGS
jgi:hypothetical protein